MYQTRELRFAGTFFPKAPNDLKEAVDLGLSNRVPATKSQPRAVISAHAGYRFSGRFTGMSLSLAPNRPGRVVILSPSHRHSFRGIAFPSWGSFDTGVGQLPVERGAVDDLAKAGLAHEDDAAHDNEHGIETQLPFIARRWQGMPIVPLVVGSTTPERVAKLIDHIAAPDDLFVLSSDLSHFLTEEDASKIDIETATMIERGSWTGIGSANACGSRAVAGWLASKTGSATKVLRLGMGNSGDVTGDKSRVVGYGAWGFYAVDDHMLADEHKRTLLVTARQALLFQLRRNKEPIISLRSFAPALKGQGMSFVTLNKNDRLRGCIGSLIPHRPMIADVVANTLKSAFEDRRFKPVEIEEMEEIKLKIAILSRSIPLSFSNEEEALTAITPGLDGLILKSGQHRSTLLPMVWDAIPNPQEFLRALKQKAGLSPDFWDDSVSIERYRTESFLEE